MTYTFKREEKYFVLKWADIAKYLTREQRGQLGDIATVIDNCRTADGKGYNGYVVVNEDEPYAEQVWQLVEAEERRKKQ